MGRAARVTSVDAVDTLKAALQRFGDDASAALSDLELELRRGLEWIQHDRKIYWDQEVRHGWDRVAQARQELERHRMLHKVADHEPGCREEKKALAQAKHRLHVAQEKVEAVRRWSRAVEKEVHEYRGSVNQLAHWLQSDLPRAAAVLHRMAGALDTYVRLHSTAERLASESPGLSTRAQPTQSAGSAHAPPEQEEPSAEEASGQAGAETEEKPASEEN